MMKFVASLCPDLISELEKTSCYGALDGKTIRSIAKMAKYDSPLHIVSAYASELGAPFAQKTIESKSNEISALQELIKTLDMHLPDACVEELYPRQIKVIPKERLTHYR